MGIERIENWQKTGLREWSSVTQSLDEGQKLGARFRNSTLGANTLSSPIQLLLLDLFDRAMNALDTLPEDCVLPSRGTSTSWRNGPTGTSGRSTRSAKSYPWKATAPGVLHWEGELDKMIYWGPFQPQPICDFMTGHLKILTHFYSCQNMLCWCLGPGECFWSLFIFEDI